ncbi:MAG TPA: DinB family protein [Rhodothermales bacterium]|nr:DinB family protein [Rhodothermales bacterium]
MDLVERLERSRDQTLAYYDLDEDALARRYGPDKWSARFVLHHLADAETVLNDRIRRVLSEPRGVIWAFDQDAWARGLDYEHLPLQLSRDIFRALREGILHLARTHLPEKADLEFVHSTMGVRTLGQEFEKVAEHNEHHLAQIAQALR